MPKETFYNLNPEKKRKIFDAAVREFSARRFSDASLNQIVKSAEIPWGSFYQYFTDKEDLFQYVYETILAEKRDIIRDRAILDPDADVFEACIEATKATYEWSRKQPEYGKISMLMELDDSAFIAGLQSDSAKGFREMVERDKARGLIKPDVDSELVVDMIYALILKEYKWVGLDEKTFMKRLGDAVKVIREGVAVWKGESK